VAGQPHIMVRFMAITDPDHIRRARAYYYAWFAAFYSLTIGAGLATRLYATSQGAFDMELALPLMAQHLLPGVGAGIVLAGLFAATMSTADSQILSCTAAVTQDFVPSYRPSLLFTKITTMVVTAGALAVALSGNQSVFSLVLVAWAGLASAFIPLLLVQAYGGKPSQPTCLAMMLSGLGVCVIWQQLGLGSVIY